MLETVTKNSVNEKLLDISWFDEEVLNGVVKDEDIKILELNMGDKNATYSFG